MKRARGLRPQALSSWFARVYAGFRKGSGRRTLLPCLLLLAGLCSVLVLLWALDVSTRTLADYEGVWSYGDEEVRIPKIGPYDVADPEEEGERTATEHGTGGAEKRPESDEPQGEASEGFRREEMHFPTAGQIAWRVGWQHHAVYGDWRYERTTGIRTSGEELVRAAFDGVVCSTGERDGLLTVRIEHGGVAVTEYASLSAVWVEDGQHVERGEPVGLSGRPRGFGYDLVLFTLVVEGEVVDPLESL